jgi:hypothetical protein
MTSRHGLTIVATALIAAACSSASPGASSSAPIGAASLPAETSSTTVAPNPSEIAVASSQPTPGDIDPCTLLTTDEASTLMGKTLSAGVSTVLDPDRVCTWRSGLSEVKLILAPSAPDAATAQQYWDGARADIAADIPVTDVSGFDRAAYGSGASAGVSVSALFVIQGARFFDLFCGFPACSQDASVTAAHSIVGRLP